jgi:hypothetical protein
VGDCLLFGSLWKISKVFCTGFWASFSPRLRSHVFILSKNWLGMLCGCHALIWSPWLLLKKTITGLQSAVKLTFPRKVFISNSVTKPNPTSSPSNFWSKIMHNLKLEKIAQKCGLLLL